MKFSNVTVILIHGNSNGTAEDAWFPYIKEKLENLGCAVIAKTFPDADLARAQYWLPFLEELGAGENTVLIGHSSGALAAMRYAEDHRILGSVLVGVSSSDLGIEKEKQSGYFDTPWQWEKIKNNQQFIHVFTSFDDPYIPIEEQKYVGEQLNAVFYEFDNKGHFADTTLPELYTALEKQISEL